MNADMKWLDNPEVFRVNQLEAHSDHTYYESYEALEKKENALIQSLNGQWEFVFSKNVKSRPENFYEEDFDAKNFDKIMVPGHIELAGYDKIRYINTMYPWEGKEYRRGAYSMESTGDGAGMFSEAEYNPVGSYIKRFDLDPELCSKRVRICFEGVEEAMYLWLNGQFVGYAEDSFTPSEFDLTPFIRGKGQCTGGTGAQDEYGSIPGRSGFLPLFWKFSEMLPCVRFLRSIWRMCGSARNCIRIMRAANYP